VYAAGIASSLGRLRTDRLSQAVVVVVQVLLRYQVSPEEVHEYPGEGDQGREE
jgi:hypothetical protein